MLYFLQIIPLNLAYTIPKADSTRQYKIELSSWEKHVLQQYNLYQVFSLELYYSTDFRTFNIEYNLALEQIQFFMRNFIHIPVALS